MLTVTGLLVEEPVQFTAGIKSLVSNKMNMKHPLTGLDQLKNELWLLRTGCKRIAREILLVYYPELSPNTEKLLEWARNNQTVFPSGMKRDREELLVPYRKAMIADLTGVEGPGQKRKAKFIYDLNRVCAKMFLLLPVVINLSYVGSWMGDVQSHTATRFFRK